MICMEVEHHKVVIIKEERTDACLHKAWNVGKKDPKELVIVYDRVGWWCCKYPHKVCCCANPYLVQQPIRVYRVSRCENQ
jgi:hypothetical protein